MHRLAVQRFGGLAITQQRSRPGLNAERPVRAAGACSFGELLEGGSGGIVGAAARSCLDQLGQRPAEDAEILVLDARCAAANARTPRRAGSGVSLIARSRKAAAAANPPRACVRPADRSSSAATSSSGPAAAWARCQARRLGSVPGSVASARAWWARRRSAAGAAR